MGGALVALLASPGLAVAQGKAQADEPLVLLLKGVYEPVVHGADLGLHLDLDDGSYSTTLIYAVSGVPGNKSVDQAVGRFYVQFAGSSCAYHLPGGSLAMRFESVNLTPSPDGQGGFFLDGTLELAILEGTGTYRALVGGHNHMVDHLHQRADGTFDEYCFCFISPA